MRSDQDIAKDAADRLHAVPGLDDQDIAIKVRDHLVLLAGIVRSDLERAQAARAVKEIRGVIGLTNCLKVLPRTSGAPPDPQITREAVAAIRHQLPGSWEELQVLVQNSRAFLEGAVEWHYQRDVIESTVRSVRGITLVTNRIRVRNGP